MFRSLWLAVLTAMVWIVPAWAQDAGFKCHTAYYRNKNPQCVEDFVASIRRLTPAQRSQVPQAPIGFLAELLRLEPDWRPRLLLKDDELHLRSLLTLSLFRGGMAEQGRTYAEAAGLSNLAERLRASEPPLVSQVRPHSYPGDNDLLIGAFMASGDAGHLERVLGNFATLDDEAARIALRLGLLYGKFGPNLSVPGRPNTLIPTICAKYDCRSDPRRLLHLLTAAAGIWALNSLAQQGDDLVAATIRRMVAKDSRLGPIVRKEQAAFSNYLTLLTAAAMTKDDRTITDALAAYENLGFAEPSRP